MIALSASDLPALMVGIAFAAVGNCVDARAHCRGGVSLVVLTPAWFEMPATCSSAADKTAMIGKRMRGAPQRGGTSSAQYLVDHIFVYRCNQNLPDKSSDI